MAQRSPPTVEPKIEGQRSRARESWFGNTEGVEEKLSKKKVSSGYRVARTKKRTRFGEEHRRTRALLELRRFLLPLPLHVFIF